MAFKQGVLTQRNITHLQRWALAYLDIKTKDKKYEERDEFIKILTRIIDPELYFETFDKMRQEKDLADGGDGSGDRVVKIEDIDDMDAFLKTLESEYSMSPSQDDDEGIGEWQ